MSLFFRWNHFENYGYSATAAPAECALILCNKILCGLVYIIMMGTFVRTYGSVIINVLRLLDKAL